MKITKEFEKEIAPFFWVEHEESASVCLNVGEYLQEIFDTREDEGFEGSGYDWGSLAPVSYTHLLIVFLAGRFIGCLSPAIERVIVDLKIQG